MKQRAFALDALRGYAIITMVLSATVVAGILPSWMYHAQTPPPTHAYDMNISGLTWVDLVFPFFLFAMGAALPFSLGSRLDRGVARWRLVADTALRWLKLAFFAIFIQHFYPYVLSSPQDVRSWLLALLAFGLLFPMFMRFERLPKWGAVGVKVAAYGAAVALLLATDYAGGRTFSPEFSNIIILILSNVALFGGVLYIFTARNVAVRLVVMGVVALLVLGADVQGSWAAGIMGWSPVWWLLRMDYVRYLLILIPASIAGEWLVESMRTGGVGQRNGRSDLPAVGVAVVAFGLVVGLLWSVNNHLIGWAFAIAAVAVVALWALLRRVDAPMGVLWRKLLTLMTILLLLGLVAEPLQGGVKKDPATVSYLLLTAGLATSALLFFSVVCDYFGCHRPTAFLTKSGQNPMVAYVAGDLVVYPLLNLTGGVALLWPLYASPWLGLLHGVVLTTLSVLLTMLTTKLRLFWRT